ncbi:copper resistance CopC family protein [Streptomyces sp. NPDC006339]|uniref:copper resistance CopC family protein n=1 Tax=Streptomyces sp. NPDC006339 TaxID=3156755 RepID=UPI00339E5B05
MFALHRRAARPAARLLIAPAAPTAVAFAASPAAAHTDLDSSSPAREALLSAPPSQVTLTFSDPMNQKYAKVAVATADGASAAQGAPQVTGKSVALPFRTDITDGRYTVGYRMVSADGHPVSGSYSFTIEATKPPVDGSASPGSAPAGPDAPTSTAIAMKTAPVTAASTPAQSPAGVSLAALAGAGALIVAGGFSAYAVRRRRARHGD